MYTASNGKIAIKVRKKSAELVSLVDLESGKEYMWSADPAHWAWSSPILFPQIGACKDNQYQYAGKTYEIMKHGFARHRDFELVSADEQAIWLSLKDDEETWKQYPFHFELQIGYELQEKSVKVIWKVKNLDDKTIYYAIGGHPAFNCPLNPGEKQTDCQVWFHGADQVISHNIELSTGLTQKTTTAYPLEQERLAITEHLFDHDALVVEEQVHAVSLINPEGKPYLTVEFDAPLFGVWAPVGGKAPFVCIEPWYGRCDQEDFDGTLAEREYENDLAAGETKEYSYQIRI